MNNRNYKFDILKSIALILIILAHMKPNGIIMQIRNFDVILMIFVSVILSVKSIEKVNFKYIEYIIKRIKRLVIPTWIFLSVYFGAYLIVFQKIDIKQLILSYSLIGGIGYVWIIRVYIYVAIVTPLINKIYNKLKKVQYYIIIVGIYGIYSYLVNLDHNFQSKIINVLFRASILDFIGYSIVVFIIIGIKNLRKKAILINIMVFSAITIILAFRNNFMPTQEFKYPIQMYYISYSMSVGLLIYLIVDKINQYNLSYLNKCSVYLSNHSMWIYLWHILYVPVINKILVNNLLVIRLIAILVLTLITELLFRKFICIFKTSVKGTF